MRELTLVGILHPEFLEDGAYIRVDHPGLNTLTQGDPTLGWDGDARLAVYVHAKNQNFVLFRLEADAEYSPIAKLPAGRFLNEETVNSLIESLIAHDTRRGFDPMVEIDAAQAKVAQDQQDNLHAFIADYADKLHWGLANSHLPGVDITRPRQVTSRR